MWPDGWTAVTADGSRSAQFEHTLLVIFNQPCFESLSLLTFYLGGLFFIYPPLLPFSPALPFDSRFFL